MCSSWSSPFSWSLSDLNDSAIKGIDGIWEGWAPSVINGRDGARPSHFCSQRVNPICCCIYIRRREVGNLTKFLSQNGDFRLKPSPLRHLDSLTFALVKLRNIGLYGLVCVWDNLSRISGIRLSLHPA